MAGKKAYAVCKKVVSQGRNGSLVSRVGLASGCGEDRHNTEAEMLSWFLLGSRLGMPAIQPETKQAGRTGNKKNYVGKGRRKKGFLKHSTGDGSNWVILVSGFHLEGHGESLFSLYSFSHLLWRATFPPLKPPGTANPECKQTLKRFITNKVGHSTHMFPKIYHTHPCQ